MRANEDMMPKLSICHGHGSKMNFSVSDYIRGDTLSKGFPLLPDIRDDPLLVRDEMQVKLGLGNAP